MSTDGRSTGGRRPRRESRAVRGYRRAVVATIGILALATMVLAIAGAFRAPHLDDASVAAATALERPGQRLVLQADQQIEPVESGDVTVSPDLPFEVSSDGRAITVRFTGMLRALTAYDVAVAVTGTATGVSGRLEYRFTTPDLAVAMLVRDADGPDEVRSRTLAGDDVATLLSADRIQEFAVARDGIAAVLLDATGAEGRLVLAPTGEQITLDVPLPGPGRLHGLRAAPSTGVLGVVYTSSDPGGRLPAPALRPVGWIGPGPAGHRSRRRARLRARLGVRAGDVISRRADLRRIAAPRRHRDTRRAAGPAR